MTNNQLSPDKAAMLEHLRFLFGNPAEYSDGKIEIAYTPAHTGAVSKADFFDASELEKAVDFAYQINSNVGVNVYVGAALRVPDVFPGGRSSEKEYYASGFIWADLDDPGVAEAARPLYAALPPSRVVVTGRVPHLRAQVWWKLHEYETDPKALRPYLAAACATLRGDRAVVDPARVMRLAGSIAWPKKDGRVPELTELKTPDHASVAVDPAAFLNAFPAAGQPGSTQAAGETHANDDKPRNPFSGRLKITELLERTRAEGQWHVNMRDAIASMVSSGWQDEAIRLATDPYRRDRSLQDDMITPLIYSARTKWARPDPEPDAQADPEMDPETGEFKQETGLPLLYAEDITPITDTSDFVEDILRDGEFSVVYGESNCGKTFFALDLALHVALGIPWRGKAVEQGGVIYCALEGGHGTRNRIAAFKKHHGITGPIPLAVIPSNLNFLDTQGDMQALVAAIQKAKARLGNVRLLVVDTLSRALAGGDENSSEDMGQLIINADILRNVIKTHIKFVHHCGKDTAKGARGHSCLRAAVDTEIEISRTDPDSPSLIRIVKQREMEMVEDMSFKLERVVLGKNRRDKEVTSCVVVPVEVTETKREVKMTPIQNFVYDALVEALIDVGKPRHIVKDSPAIDCVSYDELRIVMEKKGFRDIMATENKTTSQQTKSATQTARLALKKHGKINFDGTWIWLIN
jgi:hypothetical protein